MDNIIDCELNYLERIIRESNDPFEKELWKKVQRIAMKGRRVGLGFTALTDCFAALGIDYKNSEAFLESLMDVKMLAELDASVDLGILKGSFEDFDLLKEFDLSSNKLSRGKNKYYQFMEKQYPQTVQRMILNNARRNVSFSTCAPSGSLSILASKMGTTSGIEPLFKALYVRRRKVSTGEKYSFKDPNTGELFQEYYVAHGGLKDYCNIVWKKDFDSLSKEEQQLCFVSSPYYKNQAEDIDWMDRLRIQSIIQKYTSSAISTTINLPANVDRNVIAQIYINAYDMGLKGCTVYVDQSRSGILVSETKKPDEKMLKHNAPKRPTSLPCNIHSITHNKQKYICTVGLMNNIPYEIFVFKNPGIDVENQKGFIIKIKSGHYQLCDTDKKVIIENMADVMIPEIEDLTRGYSYGLRHSGQIKFAVEQLQKSNGSLSDFSKVLARTLKKYILDGEKSGEVCHKCGEKLIFENGCKKCPGCLETYCA